MIHAYAPRDGRCGRVEVGEGGALPPGVLWIDLHEPTGAERALVEGALGIELPSYEEMREIEESARFYVEGEARYMTASVLAQADTPVPASFPITFILVRRALITLRRVDPKPFQTYPARLLRQSACPPHGEEVLIGLIDAFIARIADVLEKVSSDLDALSRVIFGQRAGNGRDGPDMQAVLRDLGRNEDLVSFTRETLLGLGRVLRFMAPLPAEVADKADKKVTKDQRARAKTVRDDIASLSEHVQFESHKINFLLDATLGMINIEQNRIIKLFSVVACVFLPPTLVASIYGMNFSLMPELKWDFGYPWALGLMVLSAVAPVIYFRRKGWL